ncbi:serine/arginine repetitive matrix protein 2-like isoform X2 [Cloeon dipterum]|uniref:serine/arginine repetitive matrix protein 2-like isoform X2 n=1 Tax=Cloeon dipterum TaxID=197152 RepID=UPI0032206A3E
MMSASTSRNKRKNQPVEKPSGPRPSVFDRLGTKASNSQQTVDSQNRSNFCHHWRNTGNCPFGASCKNASFHVLISPSKRAKGIEKDSKELSRSQKEQLARGKKGKGDNWAELDEGELERRRLLLQKELELQTRQEMKKKPIKKQKRSSSSSSSSTAQTFSESSKASSSKSAQPTKRKPRARRRKGKGGGLVNKQVPKELETKRMRENTKDNKKRSSSSGRQERRSRSKHRTGSSSGPKRRKNSSSSDNSSSERKRQQSKPSSHQSKMKGRSPSPDRKKKQPPAAYDKKLSPPRRRDVPESRRNSPPRGRKRSPSPARPRRRTPSPRAKNVKKHESRNSSPTVNRHRSPSPERKESRRGQTPPSPHDRHPQRSSGGGRSSRRNSPEPHRAPPRDSRGRPQGGRSPERRPRASSRELRECVDKRDYQRQEYSSPAPARVHPRGSPDNAGRPSSRDRRDEPSSSRDKVRLKEGDRDRRRDPPSDKSRDRARGRDEELPSLMNIMTQHPQHSPRRGGGRDESQDHRSSGRERGRYDRYDDRGEGSNHPEEQRGAKRSSRRDSPSRQRSQKGGRDWTDHPEQRDKDWERRGKSGTSGHRDWEEPAKQNRGGKGHRRAQSPLGSASPIKENEKDLDVKPEEVTDQRRSEGHQIGDDDSTEPPSKKTCQEGDIQAGSGVMVESDFSDFSDDDDDILNADVAEENNEATMEADEKLDSAEGDKLEKEEDEPVEDILEDMDFEEISDGELDAEEIKAGADALSVDWAALLTQTRPVKKDESEAIINRWDMTTALSRIGVPQSLRGSPHLKDLGLEPPETEIRTKMEDNKERMSFLFDKETKLQDKVPGVHAAIVMKKEQIANILNPRHQRGIDFAYGEQLKKICPFVIQNGGASSNRDRSVSSSVKQLVLDMLKGSCKLEEVQSCLQGEPRKVEVS